MLTVSKRNVRMTHGVTYMRHFDVVKFGVCVFIYADVNIAYNIINNGVRSIPVTMVIQICAALLVFKSSN